MSRVSATMAALAVALLALLFAELRGPGPSTASLPAPTRLIAPELPPAPPTATRRDDAATTMLSRPLFSPTRRPPAPVSAVTKVTTRPLPRLVGTVIMASQRSVALLQPSPDGHQVALHEGDRLGNLTVRAIRPAEVEMSSPATEGTRIRLRLGAAISAPFAPTPIPLPDPRQREPGEQDE